MKEFVLTQPYCSLEEMMSSGEFAVYKEELEQGNIEEYAIVSRIGNRYDLFGEKIDGFAKNPFNQKFAKEVEKEQEKQEEKKESVDMRYLKIEELIDNEVADAVAEAKAKHIKEVEQLKVEHQAEIEKLKIEHQTEIEQAKETVKAELIAKLNS